MTTKPISCEYNMDTACVEAVFPDGTKLAIDCCTIEDTFARNLYERSELDYLIYNAPVEYINLVLSGEIESYLRNYTDYSPVEIVVPDTPEYAKLIECEAYFTFGLSSGIEI